MNLLKLYNEVLSEKYVQLNEEDASYVYHIDGNTLKIYFEWSNGKTDWLNNFDFPAKPYRDMKNRWFAHRGFLRVWKVIEDELTSVIADKNIEHIVITGYSHGGAIATLCHEYCMFNRPDLIGNIETYAFGAPRVLWGFIRKSVKSRFEGLYIIRNKGDVVTHVPPKIFGFRNVGKMITIGDGHWNGIDAHRPESYIESLTKLQNKINKI